LEKLQCDLQRPYIFSHFFETFTSIIEVSRLGSLRWHSENTLYAQQLLTLAFTEHTERPIREYIMSNSQIFDVF
jgi:hypothetical protein